MKVRGAWHRYHREEGPLEEGWCRDPRQKSARSGGTVEAGAAPTVSKGAGSEVVRR